MTRECELGTTNKSENTKVDMDNEVRHKMAVACRQKIAGKTYDKTAARCKETKKTDDYK